MLIKSDVPGLFIGGVEGVRRLSGSAQDHPITASPGSPADISDAQPEQPRHIKSHTIYKGYPNRVNVQPSGR